MKDYIISIISNVVLGILSFFPLILGLLSLQGGMGFFSKPTFQDLVIGWSILLSIIIIVLVINIILIKILSKKCKRPKMLFVVGIFSFVVGTLYSVIFSLI
ncbi:hypothetical protein RJG79_04880 [Mycoplasmatota bacterium WC44]